MENDADLSGEEVDWSDVAPGEYEVSLTIVNGGGMTRQYKNEGLCQLCSLLERLRNRR